MVYDISRKRIYYRRDDAVDIDGERICPETSTAIYLDSLGTMTVRIEEGPYIDREGTEVLHFVVSPDMLAALNKYNGQKCLEEEDGK